MADVAAISAIEAPARRGLFVRLIGGLKNLLFGSLLCVTPVTAIIVLGWLMGLMRRVALGRLGVSVERQPTGWILGARGNGIRNRLVGGLWNNLRTGFGGLVSLALATLPFTGLWLLAWWAGWENSFNKGYEQAWVGPVVGLTGVAVGVLVMIYLPMGLAHQAVERRWRALFETRRVRRLIDGAGWGYVLLAAFSVIAALPLFGLRGLPVFVEGLIPGFADLPKEKVNGIKSLVVLFSGAYVFVSLTILRAWAARLYASAALRIAGREGEDIWDGTVIASMLEKAGSTGEPGRRSWLIIRIVRSLFLLAIWFGLVVQIFVSQFLHHNWWFWVNHPYLGLPWLP